MREGEAALVVSGLLLGVLLLAAGAVWARRSYVVVTVQGESMTPTLADGDRVLVRRRRPGQVSRGDVVVLEPPREPGRWNVKRVVALPGDPVPDGLRETGTVPDGALVVLGDNPGGSADSRQRGFFPADQLLGVALRRLGGQAL
ncbi:signal peptidase I [Nonomuraea typhae]|uniref:signal peptidase I n=1 Tax=Nonomuraea typhae TaxID=2603600 RepID=UPI001CA47DD9|nr:signal peptidase I [Nonomuraea typhae]